MTSARVLMLAGVSALTVGFYRLWCCQSLQKGAFTVGAVGLLTGAALGILRDLRR